MLVGCLNLYDTFTIRVRLPVSSHVCGAFIPKRERSVRRREGLYMAELSRHQESGGRTGQAPDGQCVMVLAIISQFSHTASSSHYMI